MKFLSSEKLSPNKYRTTEGYLICKDAILARTGKQQYRRSEIYGDSCENADDIVDVDRSEKEVFSDATLASFENKPITVEHPDESVNSTNWKSYQVGFVRDVRRGKTQDGQDVILGNLIIQDEKAIEEILNGEHTDLSCGYDCDIKDDNGLYQTNIRGNHVALCREGRAGIARIVDSKMKDSSWIGQFSKLDMLGINTESKEALDNFVKKLASKYNLQGKVFKYKNQNGYPEFHFIGERKNIEELMKNEWSSRSNKESFESIIDSNMKDAKDYSWFKGYVNGDLQSYNILQLIQKVKERQEALHTNLTGRDGNVYFVTLDPNMNADFINGKNIWIDIVKYMPDNSQKRVVSEQFSSWGECERIFNSFKMGVRDFNSLKDDGSYAIIFNKLYNGDYDSLNEVRKDFQYIKYNLTEEEKEKVLNEIANTFGESVERVRRMIGDSANAAKDSWSGVRENGVIFEYKNGYYYITHKNGEVEKVDGNRFNNVNELYKYLDNIKDSKTMDMGQHVPGVIVPSHQTYNPEYSIQQFKSYISNVIRDLYGNEYNGEKVRAISKLNAYVSQVIDDFKADIRNSNLDKRKTVQYYTQYIDALYKELADVKNVKNIDGQSLIKIDDIYEKMARSIHDSKLEDTKLNDVNLEKGDWFTFRKTETQLYKAISTVEYPRKVIAEEYKIDIFNNFRIVKTGTTSVYPNTSDIIRFNSADEALTWFKKQSSLFKSVLKKHEFDSKLKDVSLTNGDWFTLRNDYNATIYKIISVSHDVYVTDVYSVEVDFDAKKSFIRKIGSKSFHTSNIKGRDDITTLAVKFNSAEEAMNWLKRQNRLTSNLFKKNDSITKDSIESEVTNEIKRKYPSVIIHVSNYIATMGDGSRLYSLEYMFDNLPDNKHEWLQFLNYLNKKYNGPYYYDESKSMYSLSIYKKSGGDSIKDKESASVRSAIDLLEGRLARSQGYELYKDHIVIDGSNFSISTNVYNRLIELGYGKDALNNIKDSLDNKKNIIKIIKIIKCAKKGI